MYKKNIPTDLADRGASLYIQTASSFWMRLKGLLGTKSLDKNYALHILACNSVHTCFMRYAIDVVFLDRNQRVIKVVESLKPWRTALCLHAASTLELAAGQVQKNRLHVGVDMTMLLSGNSNTIS